MRWFMEIVVLYQKLKKMLPSLHYRTSRLGGRQVLVENLITIRNPDTVTDTDLAFSDESTTVIYNKEYSLIHEDALLV